MCCSKSCRYNQHLRLMVPSQMCSLPMASTQHTPIQAQVLAFGLCPEWAGWSLAAGQEGLAFRISKEIFKFWLARLYTCPFQMRLCQEKLALFLHLIYISFPFAWWSSHLHLWMQRLTAYVRTQWYLKVFQGPHSPLQNHVCFQCSAVAMPEDHGHLTILISTLFFSDSLNL